MQKFLEQSQYGNTYREWLIALCVLAGVWAGLALLRYLIRRHLARHRESRFDRTPYGLHDVALRTMGDTKWFFFVAAGMAVAYRFLKLPRSVNQFLDAGVMVLTLLQVGVWLQTVLCAGLDYWQEKTQANEAGKTMGAALVFVGRLAAWLLVFLLVLSNLGIELSALIAALGVGGIAAALAVQSTLGDLIAAFALYGDQPFGIGDFVIVDGQRGTVERIGMRSTRIRSLGGELLVIPNSDIAKARIQNFGRMRERRAPFRFGVVYSTPHETLSAIPKLVQDVVDGIEGVRFERCHFHAFGDYSLEFEVVFWVKSSDYVMYMDKQQAVNLGIFERFEQEGIEFAFPTRTLYVAEPARREPARDGNGASRPARSGDDGSGSGQRPTAH